jgi:poly(hydroxyalkanoate) granule-associated protein
MSEKKVQEELKESVQKVWLAGLGAVSLTEEKGSEFFKGLVERGESYEVKGVADVKEKVADAKEKVAGASEKARTRAGNTIDKVEEKFDDAVGAAMRRLGVPSRDEIGTLTKRVEELTALVEQLKPAPAKKKAPAKKVDAASAN